MTAEEARKAVKNGFKVACLDWGRKEFIKLETRAVYVDEKGEIYKETVFDIPGSEWEIVE